MKFINMTFSKKSRHYKLYKLTYTGRVPYNLCPYFWKVVLAVLMLIPNFVWNLPTLIGEKFMGPTDTKEYFSERAAVSLVLWFILGIIFCLISCWWYPFGTGTWPITLFVAAVALIVGIVGGLKYIRSHRPQKEKQPNILKEFIKAKYNRLCPKINWK